MTRSITLVLPPPPGRSWTEAESNKMIGMTMTITPGVMGFPGMPVGRYTCIEVRLHWTGNLRCSWEADALV